ncbi:XdhC family protein [Aeromicrobium fastidiosum]|uniref:XdhC family protein n=1 Tax=Aeromicrobium fastidiosum TaxID=52699 RepID=A0A641AMR8_9ACTN|nr:XdhC/CoxI family protein [Aeromicrobium fastidiosum]KAA1378156.1 XdhC family protein [Aeromicrobium fastidiosum]MBP2389041.1 xanthine dehydrogenase accessory factor [Aeromicrobium fastidiosum]
MQDIVEAVHDWYTAGTRFALATVIETWSSAPRPAGASMAVSEHGEVVGSVSGGCVEGALVGVAEEVLATGVPALETYGVSGADAFAVGLTCGGTIRVLVEPVGPGSFPQLGEVRRAVAQRDAVAIATSIDLSRRTTERVVLTRTGVVGPVPPGPVGDGMLRHLRAMLDHGRSALCTVGEDGPYCDPVGEVFVESIAATPSLYVFGAVDFSDALSRAAKLLGYRVVVCDARPVFATARRFPLADEVVVSWPHTYLRSVDVRPTDVICVLTHDPKFDLPLLQEALASDAGYVGAMGSRSTHEHRISSLIERGVSREALERLRSPIGLDLGGSTPEETAVSILAEVIADRRRGTGRRLSELTTAIHGSA